MLRSHQILSWQCNKQRWKNISKNLFFGVFSLVGVLHCGKLSCCLYRHYSTIAVYCSHSFSIWFFFLNFISIAQCSCQETQRLWVFDLVSQFFSQKHTSQLSPSKMAQSVFCSSAKCCKSIFTDWKQSFFFSSSSKHGL